MIKKIRKNKMKKIWNKAGINKQKNQQNCVLK